MTIALQTLLSKSEDRMGDGINKIVKESALEVIRRAYAEGVYMQISSGYRSIAEQNALYVKGRRGIKGEKKVTNAKGGESVHNYGLAVDFFLYRADGRTAHWDMNTDIDQDGKKDWMEVVTIAKDLGFEWGGDWTSFYDPPHMQMVGGLTLAQLQKGQRPNLVSKVPGTVQAASNKKEVDDIMNIPLVDLVGEDKLNKIHKIISDARVEGIIHSTDWEIKAHPDNRSITVGEYLYIDAEINDRRYKKLKEEIEKLSK